MISQARRISPHPQISWFHAPRHLAGGSPAIHTPPKPPGAGHRWAGTTPPTPHWNASESPVIARRCPQDISSTKGRHPCGENGLKSALRESGPSGTRTCPAGRAHRLKGFRFDGAVCGVCPLRPQCVAAKPGTGRTVQLHPQETLLQQARALQQSEAFAEYRQRGGDLISNGIL